ncbi:MAG: hypothetical protein V3R86_05375, partial [Candidatus Hydrothermarchaeaceae archaeon]
ATIENWGYDKIFVSLPVGWTIDPIKSSAARSFPVRETGLWRIYGMPKSGKTMLGRGEVFTGKGFSSGNPTKSETTVGGRTGWWLRPNEGLLIDIYVNEIASSGVIDPLKIEKENPSIRVVKWYEVFILELSEAGFITAPWIVEGAALVEGPAPYSNSGKENTDVYYNTYRKEELDVPAWDEWFNLKNSLVYMLTKTTLAPIDLEFPSSDVEVTIKPVWRVDTTADIRYAYEWSSYQKVVGMSLWRDSALDVPDWFELF